MISTKPSEKLDETSIFLNDFVYLFERERVHEKGGEGHKEREK